MENDMTQPHNETLISEIETQTASQVREPAKKMNGSAINVLTPTLPPPSLELNGSGKFAVEKKVQKSSFFINGTAFIPIINSTVIKNNNIFCGFPELHMQWCGKN